MNIYRSETRVRYLQRNPRSELLLHPQLPSLLPVHHLPTSKSRSTPTSNHSFRSKSNFRVVTSQPEHVTHSVEATAASALIEQHVMTSQRSVNSNLRSFRSNLVDFRRFLLRFIEEGVFRWPTRFVYKSIALFKHKQFNYGCKILFLDRC